MKLNQVEKILSESNQDDWIVDDESGSFTYKDDLNLHIERAPYESYRSFNESWATSHPDNKALAVEYTIKYGSSFVDKKTLVSVDGHRATLPMPKSQNDLTVDKSDVNFAKIVDTSGRVDEYLERSNIKEDSDDQ
ncbi:hypothetical protein I5F07_19930 [Proteus vulgaris]|jgi:hypothetical protein|uniref:hypothetical protein n=1 Tax=Morganellaceae TaxID=1903414 RepID=UPI0015B2E0AC|nr:MULTISPECIES: hypothetical protein [Morganellaceae]EJD6329729.1 hypothetical protein [Proteus mirabilis]EJD6412117.1 hypothetical protein [Providencia rettgeri]MBG5987114.1 hypothetical protein [Proteus vulgaris]MBT0488965.1 hypothetical protein [Morganella morganii subsp. morganii]